MPARLGYQERSSRQREPTMAIDDEDKPLDPAVERVRRRMARFMAINLGILFVAVMAVVAAIVYKLGQIGEPTQQPAAAGTALPPSGEGPVEGTIALPAGAQVTGQTLSGSRLVLDATLADGGHAIFVYDIAERRMIGRFDIVAQP
jgi:hypothetical protein